MVSFLYVYNDPSAEITLFILRPHLQPGSPDTSLFSERIEDLVFFIFSTVIFLSRTFGEGCAFRKKNAVSAFLADIVRTVSRVLEAVKYIRPGRPLEDIAIGCSGLTMFAGVQFPGGCDDGISGRAVRHAVIQLEPIQIGGSCGTESCSLDEFSRIKDSLLQSK